MSNEKNAESQNEKAVQINERRHPKKIRVASAAVGASSVGTMAFGSIVIDV